MKKLKEHLINIGFDAITENEYENDKMNVEFLKSCYCIRYYNASFYGQIFEIERFKEVINRINQK